MKSDSINTVISTAAKFCHVFHFCIIISCAVGLTEFVYRFGIQIIVTWFITSYVPCISCTDKYL